MPFCPKCGTQNSEWAQNCVQCAALLPQRPGQGGTGQPAPGGYLQTPSYGAPPYGSYPPAPAYPAGPPANYAGIGKRFIAYLLDGLIAGVGAVPGIALIALTSVLRARSEPDSATVVPVLFGILVLYGGIFAVVLFNVYLLGRDGATLGKRAVGIKVLDQTGRPLGFWKALLRELVKGLLGNCFILLLWPLWDKEKQGLYDKIFNTHVFNA